MTQVGLGIIALELQPLRTETLQYSRKYSIYSIIKTFLLIICKGDLHIDPEDYKAHLAISNTVAQRKGNKCTRQYITLS